MNINDMLKLIINRNASDLHLTVGIPPVLRIDGYLVYMDLPSLTRNDTEMAAKHLLGEEKKLSFDSSGEADASYVIPGQGLFRVNCYRQRGVTGVAIRVLKDNVLSIDELELPSTLATMARRNHGLILVTGPTGSGKTTTLAAMTDLINSEKELHIITLEDPIEYFHKHKKSIVTQREIGRDSLSFPSALRSALRQDPDVIVVGEMRDLETISIAITAAETGHLVMATLHTIDAAQTVERIIDSFPSDQQQQVRVQLANSLVGIVSQRLVRRRDSGGRIAAVEILYCNPAVRNLIREGKIHQIHSIMQIGSKLGMKTMDKHLQTLCDAGIVNYEECLAYAKDRESMSLYIEQNNVKIKNV